MVIGTMKRMVENSDRPISDGQRSACPARKCFGPLEGRLDALIAGVQNQSSLFNDKLQEVIEGVGNQSRIVNDKLAEVIVGLDNQVGADCHEA